jgi:hypothetical protein
MRFGNTSGPGTAAYRRRTMANTNAITTYEADLASDDRTKQKEAIKKFLGEVVKDDWKWEWLPPPPEPNSTQEGTPHSEVGDPVELEWKERDEWLSGASDSEPDPSTPGPKFPMSVGSQKSPFRFDNPNDVGDAIQKTGQERKRRRKKRLREEMEVNDGLRCFIERRDAWTGARHIAPARAPSPTKRQSQSSGDGSSTAVELEEAEESDDVAEIPLAPSLIPPTNAMRKSIQPDAYNTIYDKVILQQLTPSCPMNLKDVTRSCVQGWKRDGQWPPKSVPESPRTRRRRMSVANLFSSDKRDRDPKDKAKENEGDKKDKNKDKKDGTGTLRKIKKIMKLGHGNTENAKDNDEEAPAA